ncbi:MAG: type II toxin-antitoxin system HicA family toxin [Reyranellaceae bacterium]
MKLPRDLSGSDLAKALGRLGYGVVRQTGSHVRLTRGGPKQHHITVPAQHPLKLGTLAAILNEVAAQQKMDRDELLRRLFD